MLKFLFAAATSLEDNDHLKKTSFFSGKLMEKETAIILIAVAIIAGALLLWAMFVRKPPKEVLGSRVLAGPDRKSQRYGSGGRRRHRKRRPTHPDNFGRRPTLAETGGLPPLRPDDPPSPTATSRPPEGFSPPV